MSILPSFPPEPWNCREAHDDGAVFTGVVRAYLGLICFLFSNFGSLKRAVQRIYKTVKACSMSRPDMKLLWVLERRNSMAISDPVDIFDRE
jgi:hypothetical protein